MKETDWTKLREQYFRDCTHRPMPTSTNTGGTLKINMAPHDLFEWFKKNINKG